jgi:hypothetical protein
MISLVDTGIGGRKIRDAGASREHRDPSLRSG